jgi:hypothetical protein
MLKVFGMPLIEYGKEYPERIPPLQVAVYVMCGGGHLGRFAAEQPADFYIDERCGRLPYRRKEIVQAVAVLASIAQGAGLDPHKMPEIPDFHSCGIF